MRRCHILVVIEVTEEFVMAVQWNPVASDLMVLIPCCGRAQCVMEAAECVLRGWLRGNLLPLAS